MTARAEGERVAQEIRAAMANAVLGCHHSNNGICGDCMIMLVAEVRQLERDATLEWLFKYGMLTRAQVLQTTLALVRAQER